jgi:hypothetical protein
MQNGPIMLSAAIRTGSERGKGRPEMRGGEADDMT